MTSNDTALPVTVTRPSLPTARRLTDEQFQGLAAVPAEAEWFANINNPRTRRAYESDLKDFMKFVGIRRPEEFRIVTRAHVIAWRDELKRRVVRVEKSTDKATGQVTETPIHTAPSSIRRKLSALSSLFEHLCESNAITHNVVDGVKRPGEGANEGKTKAIDDAQARALLNAPDPTTLKGKRDRAMLAVFLYHGLRCEELCRLRVRDVSSERGGIHLHVHGKRDKHRKLPAHPTALERIDEYLEAAGHGTELGGALFRPVKNPGGPLAKHLTSSGVYQCVLKHFRAVVCTSSDDTPEKVRKKLDGFCVHALRSTAATNALEHQADIAKVQHWLGHASIATTRLYDHRENRPADSPTFKVSY